MVTLSSADNALKSIYLGVVANQLNTEINPLLAKIEQTTSDVWGKEIRKLAPYGLNGGIGAGTEDGDLPLPSQNTYAQFVLTLKNLYGTIEISDKAIRASQHNSGAFVDLLGAEMEGLLRASKFNFGRMLFGDGTGALCKVVTQTNNVIKVDNIQNIMEGMIVEVLSYSTKQVVIPATRITGIDRAGKYVILENRNIASNTASADDILVIQGSYNKELTGLGAIFGSSDKLYGLSRNDNHWLSPTKTTVKFAL